MEAPREVRSTEAAAAAAPLVTLVRRGSLAQQAAAACALQVVILPSALIWAPPPAQPYLSECCTSLNCLKVKFTQTNENCNSYSCSYLSSVAPTHPPRPLFRLEPFLPSGHTRTTARWRTRARPILPISLDVQGSRLWRTPPKHGHLCGGTSW